MQDAQYTDRSVEWFPCKRVIGDTAMAQEQLKLKSHMTFYGCLIVAHRFLAKLRQNDSTCCNVLKGRCTCRGSGEGSRDAFKDRVKIGGTFTVRYSSIVSAIDFTLERVRKVSGRGSLAEGLEVVEASFKVITVQLFNVSHLIKLR